MNWIQILMSQAFTGQWHLALLNYIGFQCIWVGWAFHGSTHFTPPPWPSWEDNYPPGRVITLLGRLQASQKGPSEKFNFSMPYCSILSTDSEYITLFEIPWVLRMLEPLKVWLILFDISNWPNLADLCKLINNYMYFNHLHIFITQ